MAASTTKSLSRGNPSNITPVIGRQGAEPYPYVRNTPAKVGAPGPPSRFALRCARGDFFERSCDPSPAMPTTGHRLQPETRRRAFRSFFSNLGPGLIAGAADDDPSGISTYSVAGASF